MCGLEYGVICHVEQTEDHDQHYWDDDQQSILRTLLIFVLAAPRDVIARWQLSLANAMLSFFNKTADISAADIQEYRSAKSPFSLWIIVAPSTANLRNLRREEP